MRTHGQTTHMNVSPQNPERFSRSGRLRLPYPSSTKARSPSSTSSYSTARGPSPLASSAGATWRPSNSLTWPTTSLPISPSPALPRLSSEQMLPRLSARDPAPCSAAEATSPAAPSWLRPSNTAPSRQRNTSVLLQQKFCNRRDARHIGRRRSVFAVSVDCESQERVRRNARLNEAAAPCHQGHRCEVHESGINLYEVYLISFT